jgi:hypothetical protein
MSTFEQYPSTFTIQDIILKLQKFLTPTLKHELLQPNQQFILFEQPLRSVNLIEHDTTLAHQSDIRTPFVTKIKDYYQQNNLRFPNELQVFFPQDHLIYKFIGQDIIDQMEKLGQINIYNHFYRFSISITSNGRGIGKKRNDIFFNKLRNYIHKDGVIYFLFDLRTQYIFLVIDFNNIELEILSIESNHNLTPYEKINQWIELQIKFQEIGLEGEKFVIQHLTNMGYHVEHVALFNDQAGYDLKCQKDDITLYIEVKTTTQTSQDTPFYISRNEKSFIERNFQNSFIYRVYNFDLVKKEGNIKIIHPNELSNYQLEPVNYQVKLKQ